MEFTLTESQTLLRDTARDFARRVLVPKARQIDESGEFPADALRQLGHLGLLAVNVDESLGGAGAGAVAYALAMEEVAYGCASTAVTMAVTNMVSEVLARFGTEGQKAWIARLASFDVGGGSFALSESGAGSDPGAMRTMARPVDGGWVLNGGKQWITTGAQAGVFVVWARTGSPETHPGSKGISCFVVPSGTAGLRIGRAEDKLGLRGSSTVALEFEDCRLPSSALLGELHGGFKIAMMALDGGRIGISAQALGIARAALDASVHYAKERRQFGKTLGEFQAIQWKLSDMKTELDAARLLCHRAAWLKENGKPFSKEAAMSKVFATETAFRVTWEAIQIHGGYGYTREFPVERHMRDVRATMIYEGTSEIQRMVIARSLMGS